MRLPFYAALRREFPSETCHIAIMLTSPIAKFLSPLPFFDEIIESPNMSCAHPIRWIFSRCRFVDSSLRWALVHKVDVCINPLRFRSLGHDYILKLTMPNMSVAYEAKNQVRLFPATAEYQKARFDKIYTHLMPIITNVSQIDEMRKILSMVRGGREAEVLPLSLNEFGAILDFSVEKNLVKPYVVVVPGAGAGFRRWPVERFAHVASRLLCNVVVVGTEEESALGNQIPCAINLCGKTSLAQLGGVLAGACLVIANETGTATYAAAIGVRTLCLLGGGDFKAYFPNDFYKNTFSIYHYTPCFSCMWTCSHPNHLGAIAPCVNAINEEEVYNAAKEMLRS